MSLCKNNNLQQLLYKSEEIKRISKVFIHFSYYFKIMFFFFQIIKLYETILSFFENAENAFRCLDKNKDSFLDYNDLHHGFNYLLKISCQPILIDNFIKFSAGVIIIFY